MFKFCFKKSLGFVFILTLSTTSLLASSFGIEDEDAQSIHSDQHIDHIPDELHLVIFSFLTPKDAPSVTRVSSRWQRLMDDNQLWKEYARRAQLLLKADPFPGRNYKAFVRDHCTFSFTDLGFLNGGSESIVLGASVDGSVIVGHARDGAAQDQKRAFRWTAEKGMESLGTLNGGSESIPLGISAEGSVIVGEATDGAEQNQRRAFRWTAEKGMESLGTLNEESESWAWGVSAEGSVIVGHASDGIMQSNARAFRWTAEKGMESVEKMLTEKGLLPAQWRLTRVTAITPSGTVLIGEGIYNDGSTGTQTRAWRAVIPRANLF